LTGASFEIRSARPEDAPAIRRIYAPLVEETIISFEAEPPSEAEMAGRIEATMQGYPYLAAVSGAALLGYAYAGPHRARAAYRFSVDVTVYVAERAQRRGVGRRLYEDLLGDLKERGFHAAFAGIALPNPASIALHEAVGFSKLGVYREVGFKFDRWHDVGWWQRLL